MRLTSETLAKIENRLGLLDEIWEQAEGMGLSEEAGMEAADDAKALMMAAISHTDLGWQT